MNANDPESGGRGSVRADVVETQMLEVRRRWPALGPAMYARIEAILEDGGEIPPLLAGGQGRTDADLTQSAAIVAGCALCIALCIVLALLFG